MEVIEEGEAAEEGSNVAPEEEKSNVEEVAEKESNVGEVPKKGKGNAKKVIDDAQGEVAEEKSRNNAECNFAGCTEPTIHGVPGSQKPEFCLDHMEEGMNGVSSSQTTEKIARGVGVEAVGSRGSQSRQTIWGPSIRQNHSKSGCVPSLR